LDSIRRPLLASGGVEASGGSNVVYHHMWFSLAASLGTCKVREDAAEARDRTVGRMDPTQMAEAERLAREWDTAHPR
jgi:hypothetical protein